MFVESVFILVFTLECWSGERRQFNHYPEYLQAKALRLGQKSKGLGVPSYLKHWKSQEKKEKGPPRTLYYNPTYGYEPYWKTGDWVFERKKKDPKDKLDPDSNCGEKCFKAYTDYGPVCARNVNGTYRNFTSICAVRTYDCRGTQGWMVAYRGHCRRVIDSYLYPGTHFDFTREPITRALSIIAHFSKQYNHVVLDPNKKWER